MNRYFEKFPLVKYNNYMVRDLTSRVAVTSSTLNNPFAFYSYGIEAGERPDQLADRYYGDKYMCWLLYLGNKIIDPYYGWYLTQEEFSRFIEEKHGSIEEALRRTAFWRVSWHSDDTVLTTSFYDNTLDDELRKYWDPIFNEVNGVVGWVRRKVDWVVNTNKIVRLEVTPDDDAHEVGEYVRVYSGVTHVGNAEVVRVADSGANIFVQHVEGAYANGYYVVGATSGANATVLDTEDVQVNILPSEGAYWERVSRYEAENEINEGRRSISVLDSAFAPQANKELKDLLKV